jgi:hypothetical protein
VRWIGHRLEHVHRHPHPGFGTASGPLRPRRGQRLGGESDRVDGVQTRILRQPGPDQLIGGVPIKRAGQHRPRRRAQRCALDPAGAVQDAAEQLSPAGERAGPDGGQHRREDVALDARLQEIPGALRKRRRVTEQEDRHSGRRPQIR